MSGSKMPTAAVAAKMGVTEAMSSKMAASEMAASEMATMTPAKMPAAEMAAAVTPTAAAMTPTAAAMTTAATPCNRGARQHRRKDKNRDANRQFRHDRPLAAASA
jgi:hypothetical protein